MSPVVVKPRAENLPGAYPGPNPDGPVTPSGLATVGPALPISRAIVSVQVRPTDTEADLVVSNLYFLWKLSPPASSSDWTTFANSVLACFNATAPGGPPVFSWYANRGITVRTYDMAAPKPRPVTAEVVYTPTSWETGPLSPRELAVPMRYFSAQNVKSQRGRIYLGPLILSAVTEVFNVSTLGPGVLALGRALTAIGSGDAVFCVWSRTHNLMYPVTNFWVNDQWAHMESRQHVEQARQNSTFSPGVPVSPGPVLP